jgi:NAD(P)-dependent dehydrogenase (short-subunit alcohol dehydrogenase family)
MNQLESSKASPLGRFGGAVIITGASGNLGQAVVNKFIAEGYKVIGTVIPNDPVPMNFPSDKFEKVVVDLMNEEDTEKFISSVIDKYKSIDAAVLTVGGFAMGKIADTSAADIMKQYKLNFETAYNIARPAFIQMMKQNSGRIFIIGARPGLQAWHGNGMVAYGLAKSLVVRLAELINIEAKGHNVVASVVVPSTIDTPQNRKAMPDADFTNWVKPEDIANVIYYHCLDETSALRETVIKVYNNS